MIYKLIKITFTLYTVLAIQGCALSTKDQNKRVEKELQLTKHEQSLVDRWSKDKIPSCRFVYTISKQTDISRLHIINCIKNYYLPNEASKPPYNIPPKLIEKVRQRKIDLVLGEKLFRYFDGLSEQDLTWVLKRVIRESLAENYQLITTLIDKGAITKDILPREMVTGAAERNTCRSSLALIRANKHLYKQQKYLDTPLPFEKYPEFPSDYTPPPDYPRDELYYTTIDPLYAHCPNTSVAEALIKINPDLRNIANKDNGNTALHNYAKQFTAFNYLEEYNATENWVSFGEKLITKVNVNIQNKKGQTPLHLLLTVYSPLSKERLAFAKAIIHAGADLDLRDKKGVSVRDLMLRYSGMMPLP